MVKRTNLHENPATQIGRMVAGALDKADAAHTRPTGDVIVREGFDTYWTDEDSAKTLSLRQMGRTQAELEAAMAQADIDLAAAREALAQAEQDIADSAERIQTAQAAAASALAEAQIKTTVKVSADPPSATADAETDEPYAEGTLWRQTVDGKIADEWVLQGGQWVTVTPVLDVSRLTVIDTALMAKVAAEKIIADAGYYGLLTVDRLTAGSLDVDSLVAQKIATATAMIQQAYVKNLVSDGATIDQAVIKDLASQIITSGLFRTAAEGKRLELDASSFRAYDADGKPTLNISGSDNWFSGDLRIGAQSDGTGKVGMRVGQTLQGWSYGIRFYDDDNSATNAAIWYESQSGGVSVQSGRRSDGTQSFVRAFADSVQIGLRKAGSASADFALKVDADGVWTGGFRNTPQVINSGDISAYQPGEYIVQGGVSNMPTSNWGRLTIENMTLPGGTLNWLYTYRDDLGHGYWTRTFANGKWTSWRNHLGRPDGGGGWSITGLNGWRLDNTATGGRANNGYFTYRESGDSRFLRFAFMWLGKVTAGEKQIASFNRPDPTGDVIGTWAVLAGYGDNGSVTMASDGKIYAKVPAGTGIDNLIFGTTLSWTVKAPVV